MSKQTIIIQKENSRAEAFITVADTPCMAGMPSHVLNIRKIISMTIKNASCRMDTCALVAVVGKGVKASRIITLSLPLLPYHSINDGFNLVLSMNHFVMIH